MNREIKFRAWDKEREKMDYAPVYVNPPNLDINSIFRGSTLLWMQYTGLKEEFNFNFDPCPLNSKENGLIKEWGTRTFVNPPYGREIGKWVKKSHEESFKGKIVVMLMPVRTDTNYFHDYILGKAEIRFIKGRLKFKGFSKKQNKI